MDVTHWCSLLEGWDQPSAYRLTIYRFQNIVKISRFFTISHDTHLISTHIESPYR